MEGNAAGQSTSSTMRKKRKETVVPGYGLAEGSSGKVAGISESEPTGKMISKIAAHEEEKSVISISSTGTEESPPAKRLREKLGGTKGKHTEEDESSLENGSGSGSTSGSGSGSTSGSGSGSTSGPGSSSCSGTEGKHTEEDESSSGCSAFKAMNIYPRKFRRIPIFIVDHHNDVLHFIYRSLAMRFMPLTNNIMVHFDSHPDLVMSRKIPASASYNKQSMLDDLSIENWIMPTCYAGHFNRIVWLKNSWCEQMPVGKYNFKIGQKDDRIKVDCPLDYFISEGNYCDTNELKDARDMELQVINVDTSTKSSPIDTAQFIKASDAPNFVLDIDLDFFSTSNPFIDVYRDANVYDQLQHIFYFEPHPKYGDDATGLRELQLEMLEDIFEHLELVRSLEHLNPHILLDIVTEDTYLRIENLITSLHEHYADDEIDWMLIHEAGITTDLNGLPHHVSSPEELEEYFGKFKKVIQNLPVPPVLITMACSVEDDYCPKEQMDFIQRRVLEILYEVFGERLHNTPIRYYLEEDWNMRKL